MLRDTQARLAELGGGGAGLYADPARLRAAASDPAWLGGELRHLVAVDQHVRGRFMEVWSGKVSLPPAQTKDFNRRLGAMMEAVDRESTRRLKLILDARGWRWPSIRETDAETSKNAWLLVQHADLDPAFQERVLELIRPLARTGDVDRADAAYLEDRVAVKKGLPQRYATQVDCRDGRPVPQGPAVALAEVDRNRAEAGLQPWAEYAAGFTKGCSGG